VKRDPERLDLVLLVSDRPASGAGVFTQNQVAAAPVRVSRRRVPAAGLRGIVANSGNANACTGPAGLDDAAEMTGQLALRIGCPAESVLVCSTGIIGTRLPMERVRAGLGQAWGELSADAPAWDRASRGIMTTDTVPKVASRAMAVSGREFRLWGMAKGAAMIAPHMATMLAFIVSDAAIEPDILQAALTRAVDRSFNSISVEGHMSTNDTVLTLANGAADPTPLTGRALDEFRRLLGEICTDLAGAIVGDAEGAKHFVTIDVEGARTESDARRIAKSIAESPLVKTAICGADPNWGRIVSAAGYAGVPFEERELTMWLNGTLLFDRGAPVPFDPATLSQQIRTQRDTSIRLRFESGTAAWRFWSCDLTEDYVRLNADYHT
jgi:glutamate N-acetyltransferase/amino-acid N-acetyltransferase